MSIIRNKRLDAEIREVYKKTPTNEKFLLRYPDIAHGMLAIAYRHVGEVEKSKGEFRYLAEKNLDRAKLSLGSREEVPLHIVTVHSQDSVIHGIQWDLAGDRGRGRQYFEWAAENCRLSEYAVGHSSSEQVAVANLWRGYSLLVLGDRGEACRLFRDVVPFFDSFKMSGGELQFRKLEYFIPKFLLPLCDYLAAPGEITRRRVVDGVNEFLASIPEKYELDAYLYCLHLMDRFPEAYDESVASPGRVAEGGSGSGVEVVIREAVGPGSVIILDRDHHGFLVLGDNVIVERYFRAVRGLGSYPELAKLYEVYMLEEELEPGPILEDCGRLLAVPGLDPGVRKLTLQIEYVAREAVEKDSEIMLFYDDEMDFNDWVRERDALMKSKK